MRSPSLRRADLQSPMTRKTQAKKSSILCHRVMTVNSSKQMRLKKERWGCIEKTGRAL